jgi:hypothetical protein
LILTSCFAIKDIGWKNSGDLSYRTVALQQKEDTVQGHQLTSSLQSGTMWVHSTIFLHMGYFDTDNANQVLGLTIGPSRSFKSKAFYQLEHTECPSFELAHAA